MKPISKSALSVQYDLRPAKQVERRMLVDAFQRLAQAGFEIRDYQYTGFGSIYFVDFIIFHKLLGINKLVSIEHDGSLEERVKYNCPFKCVDIKIDLSTNIIPTLSQDSNHILWLDYDEPVKSSILDDMYLAGSQLSSGSIILVTVDVEPPDKESDEPKVSKEYFENEASKYLGTMEIQEFTKSKLPRTSMLVLLKALKEGMRGRIGIEYHPIFNFLYADDHRMITIGGVIGSEVEKRKIGKMNLEGASYLRTNIDDNPYEIKVTPFTRKERHLLDSAMPCTDGWQPNEFTIPAEHIEAYREIYRFLPAYAELLI